MNLEQKSGVATTTHGVLTHHLNSFGAGDIVGTMADYTAVEVLHLGGSIAWPRGNSELLCEVVRGVRQAGDILRDAPAGGRWRHGLHRVEGRDGG
jgi:hypothetical protein